MNLYLFAVDFVTLRHIENTFIVAKSRLCTYFGCAVVFELIKMYTHFWQQRQQQQWQQQTMLHRN